MMTLIPPAKLKLHLLILENIPIFDQLQLEEALLRVDDRNWCILNQGSPPAIVMGISGVPSKLINLNHMEKNPVSLIRRFSGGGTVFIDEHTYFATWICNRDHVNVACCPLKVHHWVAEFYKKALPKIHMALRENDYVIGDLKWGGNAQYLCKGRWLHHTSMLWDYDPQNMEYLLMPEKIPKYRESRSHDEFLCRLKDYFIDDEHLKMSIVENVYKEFDVREVSLEDVAGVLQRSHRKATVLL